MGYTADISGFPYWPTEAQEKREEVWEKGWEQGKCDQMDHDDNRDDAIKKLKKENKNIKAEKKYLAKKVPKMREEIKVIKDRLHWKGKEVKGYEKGCEVHREIVMNLQEKINKLKEENEKQKKQHIQSLMKTNSLAKELYREVKYALGYGEFEEPKRQDMYDKIKELKEEKSSLLGFIVGAEDTAPVEKLIKETYNQDFIDSNKEVWEQFGLFDEEDFYEEEEVDYYVDAGRKVVLKDGRTVKTIR